MTDERKTTYTPAQKKAISKYLHESVDEFKIRVPKGNKAAIQGHAKRQGESLNQFVIRAIDETMYRDNHAQGTGLFASPAAGSPDPVRPEGVAAFPDPSGGEAAAGDPSEGEAVPAPGD